MCFRLLLKLSSGSVQRGKDGRGNLPRTTLPKPNVCISCALALLSKWQGGGDLWLQTTLCRVPRPRTYAAALQIADCQGPKRPSHAHVVLNDCSSMQNLLLNIPAGLIHNLEPGKLLHAKLRHGYLAMARGFRRGSKGHNDHCWTLRLIPCGLACVMPLADHPILPPPYVGLTGSEKCFVRKSLKRYKIYAA